MATIANLTVKSDDSFEGNLATLTVSAPIAIIPNNRKTKDSEPDYATKTVDFRDALELGQIFWPVKREPAHNSLIGEEFAKIASRKDQVEVVEQIEWPVRIR